MFHLPNGLALYFALTSLVKARSIAMVIGDSVSVVAVEIDTVGEGERRYGGLDVSLALSLGVEQFESEILLRLDGVDNLMKSAR